MKAVSIVKAILFSLLGLALGLFGLVFLFSDLGPGETLAHRYTVTVLFNLVCGLVIGLFNARVWAISGVVAWAGILIALRGLAAGPALWPEMLTVAAVSPLPAFTGGYLGALIIRKRVFRRLFRRGTEPPRGNS